MVETYIFYQIMVKNSRQGADVCYYQGMRDENNTNTKGERMNCATEWVYPKTTKEGIKAIKAARTVFCTAKMRGDVVDMKVAKKEALLHYCEHGAAGFEMRCYQGCVWLDS